MAYQALYRKFRPKEFADVKGQEHIVTALKNQIRDERIGHAYLFTGTRGTGKTTMAKIFAKAVNCEQPKEDGSPCGECAVCRSIEEGASMSVIELDAASNNSVDDVRGIIEEIEYRPTEGRYKVYIVDEVHMLSGAAFNALLKTLEEPPSYVIFILATTEVNKVPITILSRCQRYDFRRITIESIAGRLAEVMDAEGNAYEEKALSYIAKAADGSMRDALSLLDQCIAFYPDKKLSYDDALNVLGAVDTEVFSRMFQNIRKGDVAAVIRQVDEIIYAGRELPQFMTDFTWYLRNLLLVKSADGMEDVLDVSTETLAVLKEEAAQVSDEVLMRYIRLLSELLNRIRYSPQKRPIVEIGLIRMMKPQMDHDLDSVLDRLYKIEEQLESGMITVSAPVGQAAGQTPAATSNEREKLPAAVPEDVQKAVKLWKTIVADAPLPLAKYLGMAYVSVDQNRELMLVFDANDPQQDFARGQAANRIEQIKTLIGEHVGADVPVVVKRNDSQLPREHKYENAIDAFAKEIGMDIEVEDF
ncbi:MAG: DNA polymerase III subunit gamma/tau [Lachnospiraceae bacterium]|nr:DNA polymerase III subunit gamma/tau [Lachnospiraceae bacterium]